jgi:tetratricopeptide (TPR) repeat protein
MDRRAWACLLLVFALLAAYANSFRGQFVLDDEIAIERNPTIADLTNLRQVFAPPVGSAVTARPIVNLTLAVDYALWGLDVRGYHATNLLIHVGAALLLFGVVRRVWWRWEKRIGTAEPARASTLAQGKADCARQATVWAAAIAAPWALHPLQTESVTFVVMRSESLASCFYLLTLYGFVRCAEAGSCRWWGCGAAVACSLGVLSKEMAVSAPLFVLFLDRAVYAGSFREALRDRGWFYAGLLFSWLPLAAVIVQSGGARGGTCGFGTVVTPWAYLLTQCRAIVVYLHLALWPDLLCFDYGRAVVRDAWSVLPQGILLLGLAGATVVALWRRWWLGLGGLFFFAVISPSSSIVPLASQTAAEHRMYLPLLAVVVVVAAVARRILGKHGWILLALATPVLGLLTYQRNALYADPVALWQDTVDTQPNNSRARINLGNALLASGRAAEALLQYEAGSEAMRDRDAGLMANMALALFDLGRLGEAGVRAKQCLALDSRCTVAMTTLGCVAAKRGELAEAREWLEKATELAPGDKATLLQRGRILWMMGDTVEAEADYRRVLELDRNNFLAEFWLGRMAYDAGKWKDAVAHYGMAVRSNPGFAEGHNNLAGALAMAGDSRGALEHYAKTVELVPKLTVARFAYATTLAQAGRLLEAVAQYSVALEQEPGNTEGLVNSGLALQLLGRSGEARARYSEALRLEPENALARERLASLPLASGKSE